MSVPALKAGQIDTRHGTILYLEDVSVSFDGFKALNNLSLYIGAGELRCLIGPNGAGKTTLMDVITGKTRPDSGTVFFGQTIDLLQMDEPAIAQAGICRKFQKPSVFETLSVFENLELALATDKGVWATLFARLSGAQRERIEQVLETIGLTGHRSQPAGVLSHGQKQWLEIGMAAVLKLNKRIGVVANTRTIGKKDLIHNHYQPHIEVDPQTYSVRADGLLLTCEPADVLPFAQRYFLF